MKIKSLSILVLLSATSLFATDKINIASADNKVTKENVISVYADWVKDKGKKYDLGFNIKNERDKGIMLFKNEMHCYRGKEEGALKGGGDNIMAFRAGELKQFGLTCSLSTSDPGEYRVVITKVHENASGDQKTVGKELAANLIWKVLIAK